MKQQDVKKPNQTLIFFIIFIVVGVFTMFFLTTKDKKLPIYNPFDVNPKLVDSKIQHVKYGHKIADFKLINQEGEVITQKDYENKIYVADFFFTRCTTICPIMSNHMAELQNKFINDDDVKFLSMSVTPIMDSIPVLKEYALKKGATPKKWNLTTGDKKHIYELARKSYMAVLDEGDGGVQDFIHTEQFVLIDKKRQIRGFYDGTNPDDIKQLSKDIKLLQKASKK